MTELLDQVELIHTDGTRAKAKLEGRPGQKGATIHAYQYEDNGTRMGFYAFGANTEKHEAQYQRTTDDPGERPPDAVIAAIHELGYQLTNVEGTRINTASLAAPLADHFNPPTGVYLELLVFGLRHAATDLKRRDKPLADALNIFADTLHTHALQAMLLDADGIDTTGAFQTAYDQPELQDIPEDEYVAALVTGTLKHAFDGTTVPPAMRERSEVLERHAQQTNEKMAQVLNALDAHFQQELSNLPDGFDGLSDDDQFMVAEMMADRGDVTNVDDLIDYLKE